MKRKLYLLATVLVLVCVLSFTLVACGEKDNDGDAPQTALVSAISVIDADKITYDDDEIDVSGASLNVLKSDGKTEKVAITKDMLTFPAELKEGDNEITIRYEGATATIKVNITAEDGEDGEDGAPGAPGAKGEKGEKGDKGDKGDQGVAGVSGMSGKSAYELYKEANPSYTGNETEWLDALVSGNLTISLVGMKSMMLEETGRIAANYDMEDYASYYAVAFTNSVDYVENSIFACTTMAQLTAFKIEDFIDMLDNIPVGRGTEVSPLQLKNSEQLEQFGGNDGCLQAVLIADTTISEGDEFTLPDGKQLTIDESTVLTNNGTITNVGTIIVCGTIVDNGVISNTGTFTNEQGGKTKIEIDSAEEIMAVVSSVATDSVHNYAILTADVAHTATGFNIPAGKTLEIASDVTYIPITTRASTNWRIGGTLVNKGVIYNNQTAEAGTYNASLDVYGEGVIDNYGTIIDNGAYVQVYLNATLNNYEGATYTHGGITTYQQIIVAGKFNNEGTFNHSGQTMYVKATSTIVNNGVINVYPNESNTLVQVKLEAGIYGDGILNNNAYIMMYTNDTVENELKGNGTLRVIDLQYIDAAIALAPSSYIVNVVDDLVIDEGTVFTVPYNTNVLFEYSLTVNGTLDVQGYAAIEAQVEINGTANIGNFGTLINNGIIDNNGSLQVNGVFVNNATYNVYVGSQEELTDAIEEKFAQNILVQGTLTVSANTRVKDGVKLIVLAGSTLYVPTNVLFFINDGAMFIVEENATFKTDETNLISINGDSLLSGTMIMVAETEEGIRNCYSPEMPIVIFVKENITLTEDLNVGTNKIVLLGDSSIITGDFGITSGGIERGVESEAELKAAITADEYPIRTVADFTITEDIIIPSDCKGLQICNNITIAEGKALNNVGNYALISVQAPKVVAGKLMVTVTTEEDMIAAMAAGYTYVVVDADLTLAADLVITLGSTLSVANGKTVETGKKITVEEGATLENNGTLNITSTATFKNYGVFINNGTFDALSTVYNYAGGSISNSVGGTFTVAKYLTCYDGASLVNNGTMIVDYAYTSLKLGTNNGTITINAGKKLSINSMTVISNNGTINVNGTLAIAGSIVGTEATDSIVVATDATLNGNGAINFFAADGTALATTAIGVGTYNWDADLNGWKLQA